MLYADASLKRLFERYRKRTDYDNTIFVITGDHRIPEIPLSTKIDRYHVPLIIYSPLLQKTKEIADFLNENNIPANYFHAGLSNNTKDERQQKWKNDDKENK